MENIPYTSLPINKLQAFDDPHQILLDEPKDHYTCWERFKITLRKSSKWIAPIISVVIFCLLAIIFLLALLRQPEPIVQLQTIDQYGYTCVKVRLKIVLRQEGDWSYTYIVRNTQLPDNEQFFDFRLSNITIESTNFLEDVLCGFPFSSSFVLTLKVKLNGEKIYQSEQFNFSTPSPPGVLSQPLSPNSCLTFRNDKFLCTQLDYSLLNENFIEYLQEISPNVYSAIIQQNLSSSSSNLVQDTIVFFTLQNGTFLRATNPPCLISEDSTPNNFCLQVRGFKKTLPTARDFEGGRFFAPLQLQYDSKNQRLYLLSVGLDNSVNLAVLNVVDSSADSFRVIQSSNNTSCFTSSNTNPNCTFIKQFEDLIFFLQREIPYRIDFKLATSPQRPTDLLVLHFAFSQQGVASLHFFNVNSASHSEPLRFQRCSICFPSFELSTTCDNQLNDCDNATINSQIWLSSNGKRMGLGHLSIRLDTNQNQVSEATRLSFEDLWFTQWYFTKDGQFAYVVGVSATAQYVTLLALKYKEDDQTWITITGGCLSTYLRENCVTTPYLAWRFFVSSDERFFYFTHDEGDLNVLGIPISIYERDPETGSLSLVRFRYPSDNGLPTKPYSCLAHPPRPIKECVEVSGVLTYYWPAQFRLTSDESNTNAYTLSIAVENSPRYPEGLQSFVREPYTGFLVQLPLPYGCMLPITSDCNTIQPNERTYWDPKQLLISKDGKTVFVVTHNGVIYPFFRNTLL